MPVPAPADAADATAIRTVHAVCSEEAGACTLARIVRIAADGDAVIALGPVDFALSLRRLGLRQSVRIEHVPRATRLLGGEYGALGPALRRSGVRPFGASRTVAYGPLAKLRVEHSIGDADPLPDRPHVEAAAIASELPPFAACPAERRARLRRELGVAPNEVAFLVAGEPAAWIDMTFAIRALSMARVAGVLLRPIVSPATPRIAKLSVYFESAAQGRAVIVDERVERPWELLPACDALLLDRDGAATIPGACAGERRIQSGARSITPQAMSAEPALWALACGKQAIVHESIDLGTHASHPLVHRFGDDISALARILSALVPARDAHQALASSAIAASR